MKKIKNFILGMSTLLIISTFSSGCNLQKNSEENKPLNKKGRLIIETLDSKEQEEENNSIGSIEEVEITGEETGYSPTLTIEKEIEIYEDNRPYVALTFDDGPSKYTEELVALLDKYDIKCTFFVVGTSCEKYPNALSIVSESGHEIAIHGKTHTSFTKLDVEEVNQEISDTINYIESLEIDASSLVRPPYGSLNSTVKQNIDYPFILWNIDTEDWKTKDQELITAEILDNIQPGSIILMHDTKAVHEVDIEVLDEILPELVKEYHFVTVTELSEQYNNILEPGKTYRKIKNNANGAASK